jgi:MFS family permease
MKPTILVIRAIGAEFARRTFYPVVIIGAIVAVVLAAAIVWLTSLSAWWWLLMFAFICALCVGVGVFSVVFLTIRSVTPFQNPVQKKAVKEFVDKLQLLAETAGTPKFILLFHIVKDVAAPRVDGYIGTLTTATTSLKSDYSTLLGLFR